MGEWGDVPRGFHTSIHLHPGVSQPLTAPAPDGAFTGLGPAHIGDYNRDDCLSTLHLRNWLEGQRAELANDLGVALHRPTVPEAEETEDSEAQKAAHL